MRKKLAVSMLLAGLVGWGSSAALAGKFMSQASNPSDGPQSGTRYVHETPGLIGPWGQPVEARAPAVVHEPTGADYARAAILKTYPNEVLSQGKLPDGAGCVVPASYLSLPNSGGVQQVQGMGMPGPGMCGPGGCPPGMPGGGMPGHAPRLAQ